MLMTEEALNYMTESVYNFPSGNTVNCPWHLGLYTTLFWNVIELIVTTTYILPRPVWRTNNLSLLEIYDISLVRPNARQTKRHYSVSVSLSSKMMLSDKWKPFLSLFYKS